MATHIDKLLAVLAARETMHPGSEQPSRYSLTGGHIAPFPLSRTATAPGAKRS